jgi:sugar phosphate isomerase/epimerase
MLGQSWAGGPDDLLAAIGGAGYAGIEITGGMIGGYRNRPEDFARELETHRLELIAFAWASASGFTQPDAFESDLAAAAKALDFVSQFPSAILSLGSATIVSPGPRAEKFAAAAKVYNAIGAMGQRRDVTVTFHPSSHHNTLLLDGADYERIMALTDPGVIGWVPDTGHMLRGGMDVAETLQTYLDRICYLHLKDADAQGHWQMLGAGICDTRAVIDTLGRAPNFNGWLVLEEESDKAAADPAAAVRRNRQTVAAFLE